MEIDRLYLLAVPSYLQEAPPPEDAAAEEARLEAKKRADAAAEEAQWVAKMATQGDESAVASQPGYLQGVINVVLGNLKLLVRLPWHTACACPGPLHAPPLAHRMRLPWPTACASPGPPHAPALAHRMRLPSPTACASPGPLHAPPLAHRIWGFSRWSAVRRTCA